MNPTRYGLPDKGRVTDEAMKQWAHAEMHGWRITGWTVGVTALDGIETGVRTEDVKHLMGYPVERSLDLPRDAIRVKTEPMVATMVASDHAPSVAHE